MVQIAKTTLFLKPNLGTLWPFATNAVIETWIRAKLEPIILWIYVLVIIKSTSVHKEGDQFQAAN